LRAKQSVPLGDLATFTSGGTPSRTIAEYFEGNIPWVTGADLGDNDLITPRSFITDEAVNNSAVTVVPAGTILLVTRTSVGKVAIADRLLGFSQDITALTPNADMVDIRYLRSFLRAYAPRLALQARGATISGVTRGVVAAIEVPLPPLREQRRIASILDSVDNLRKVRKQSLESDQRLRDTALKVLMNQRPTAHQCRLEEVAEIQTGPFGSLLHKEDYVSGGIPLVNPTHIWDGRIRPDRDLSVTKERFRELATYALRVGDVVLGRRGEMGRAAEVKGGYGDLLCGTGSLIVRPRLERILPSVLAAILGSAAVRASLEQRAQGVTMLNLNQAIVGATVVGLPPMADQLRYVTRVQAVEELLSSHAAHLAKLDELFASLQHRAFRGEL